jgi:hypothetical protein
VSNNENWITEQEQILMFDRTDGGGDAIKMLEKTLTNRDIVSAEQGRLLIRARLLSGIGFTFLEDLCDNVEKTQMSIDNQARKDFKQIVIEQWQGKLQTAKNNLKAMV